MSKQPPPAAATPQQQYPPLPVYNAQASAPPAYQAQPYATPVEPPPLQPMYTSYPNYPPPTYNYPPPTQPVVKQVVKSEMGLISGVSSFLKGVEKVGGQMYDDVCRGTTNSYDAYIHDSPTFRLFRTGYIVQLISKINQRALRALPNAAVDCVADPNVFDPWAHWQVKRLETNIITLRNMGNQNMFLQTDKPNVYANGIGDRRSHFRIHECDDCYITFESVFNTLFHVGVQPSGLLLPAQQANHKGNACHFAVRLIYMPPPSR